MAQNHDKRYALTKEGLKFYEEMAQKEGLPLPKQSGSTSLVPAWVITRVSSRITISAVSFVIIIALGTYLFALSGHAILLMNLYPNAASYESVLSFPLAIAGFYVYSVIVGAFSGRRVFTVGSFLSASIVYAPFIILPLAFLLHIT